jgi:hypothetical protein
MLGINDVFSAATIPDREVGAPLKHDRAHPQHDRDQAIPDREVGAPLKHGPWRAGL